MKISECRGRTVWDIPVTEIRIGDRLCLWLSDASAYVVVTGWSDRTLDLSAHGLDNVVHRTFTVEHAPWWARDMLSADLSRSTFILAREIASDPPAFDHVVRGRRCAIMDSLPDEPGLVLVRFEGDLLGCHTAVRTGDLAREV